MNSCLQVKCWPVLLLLITCTCSANHIRPLPNGKVLLDGFSIEAKKRLFAKVGLTNIAFCGYGERDSMGDSLCFPVEVHDESDQRHDQLVVLTAEGVHVKPWHISNGMMTDNEQLAVWEDTVNSTN